MSATAVTMSVTLLYISDVLSPVHPKNAAGQDNISGVLLAG
jgi:hypothetical protein